MNYDEWIGIAYWDRGAEGIIMGSLRYDGQIIDFDDRVLMELMVTTTARLRRNEPFLLTWWTGEPGASARKAVWMHASADLTWSFTGLEPAVDRDRVNSMISAAGSSRGLIVEGQWLAPASAVLDVHVGSSDALPVPPV